MARLSTPTVVLVHGGFVDGSGWEGVYSILKKNGYDVTIVQNPTTSLADDVAVTKRAIAAAPGKVILVGHSYGGVVVSEAGTDPKVAGVVYIAAFAADAGDSVASLIANPPPGTPVPPILPPVDGFLLLERRSLPLRLRRTFALSWPPSWRTRRSPGAWQPWKARSLHRPGRPSLAGTLSRPTTG
jgi:pimeloyl-ACP methyl ester carboxylesterase